MNSFLTINRTVQPDNRGERCPQQLYKLLKMWGPSYRLENGTIVRAQYENVTFWRDTNEWAAYYWMAVRGRRGIQTEKFVWTFRNGQYRELCQFKPRGTPWRQFCG